jgi:hypothetical protein
VDHAGRVRGLQTGADRRGHGDEAPEGQATLAGQERGGRLAVDELHGEDLLAAALADVEDPRHVGVRHPPRELHLAAEALDHPRRAGQLRAQHLERAQLVELEIARLVDVAHSARAEQAEDLIALPDHLVRRLRGGCRRLGRGADVDGHPASLSAVGARGPLPKEQWSPLSRPAPKGRGPGEAPCQGRPQ